VNGVGGYRIVAGGRKVCGVGDVPIAKSSMTKFFFLLTWNKK